MISRLLYCSSLLSVVFLGISCTKSESDAKASSGKVSASFFASQLDTSSTLNALNLLDRATGYPPRNNLAAAYAAAGQAEGSDLQSVSYLPLDILLCGKATINGSASSCSNSTEFKIRRSPEGFDYDNFLSKEAESDTSNFVNFLNPNEVAGLGADLSYSDNNIGSYDSVLVYWARPFKVKASITLPDGHTIYTKAAKSYETQGSGLDVKIRAIVQSITTGPAEEGVFFQPNGGTYFMLPQKFEIKPEDVANQTEFKIVLAYDPDGMIKGISNNCGSSDGFYGGMCDLDLGYKISAPFINFAPVIARASETIMRETYMLRSVEGFSQPFDVRLSLYFVKEDPKKSILAVSATSLYVAGFDQATDLGNVYSVNVTEAGTMDFLSSSGSKILKNFRRMVTSGDYETITSDVCVPEKCSSGEGSSFTYTLVSIDEVQASMKASYRAPSIGSCKVTLNQSLQVCHEVTDYSAAELNNSKTACASGIYQAAGTFEENTPCSRADSVGVCSWTASDGKFLKSIYSNTTTSEGKSRCEASQGKWSE